MPRCASAVYGRKGLCDQERKHRIPFLPSIQHGYLAADIGEYCVSLQRKSEAGFYYLYLSTAPGTFPAVQRVGFQENRIRQAAQCKVPVCRFCFVAAFQQSSLHPDSVEVPEDYAVHTGVLAERLSSAPQEDIQNLRRIRFAHLRGKPQAFGSSRDLRGAFYATNMYYNTTAFDFL